MGSCGVWLSLKEDTRVLGVRTLACLYLCTLQSASKGGNSSKDKRYRLDEIYSQIAWYWEACVRHYIL